MRDTDRTERVPEPRKIDRLGQPPAILRRYRPNLGHYGSRTEQSRRSRRNPAGFAPVRPPLIKTRHKTYLTTSNRRPVPDLSPDPRQTGPQIRTHPALGPRDVRQMTDSERATAARAQARPLSQTPHADRRGSEGTRAPGRARPESTEIRWHLEHVRRHHEYEGPKPRARQPYNPANSTNSIARRPSMSDRLRVNSGLDLPS